jgi:hypothetical protein
VADSGRTLYIEVMAKQQRPTTRCKSTGAFIAAGSPSRSVITRLGDVTVRGAKPSPELVRANVARSTKALERVVGKLTKPGVHLPDKKGVPRYSADENDPAILIRRLNGKITTGRLQDGRFVESK